MIKIKSYFSTNTSTDDTYFQVSDERVQVSFFEVSLCEILIFSNFIKEMFKLSAILKRTQSIYDDTSYQIIYNQSRCTERESRDFLFINKTQVQIR